MRRHLLTASGPWVGTADELLWWDLASGTQADQALRPDQALRGPLGLRVTQTYRIDDYVQCVAIAAKQEGGLVALTSSEAGVVCWTYRSRR